MKHTAKSPDGPVPSSSFEIRFDSLFNAGQALAFPCDSEGHVDLDTLPERARNNYLFARAMVGRDFLAPRVHGA
ncbi:MAG TPA: hypothetical protein VJN44_16745 [Roseateles sp.]|nr:hypothetical protein [Roseateles sp.]